MRLGFAFIANSAEASPDGRFHVIGGGIDGFTLPSLPSMIPTLALIVSLHFSSDECEQDYVFRLITSNPDGSDFGLNIAYPLAVRINPEVPDFGSHQKLVITFTGVSLSKSGKHRFIFYVNDAEVGQLEFNVGVVPLPDQAAR
jgi:hypothetical protein